MRMPHRSLRPNDRPLDPEHQPRPGAHLVTPRCGYTHHGIYVGGSRVVQYGGLSWGLRRGPVEEVSFVAIFTGTPGLDSCRGPAMVRAAGSGSPSPPTCRGGPIQRSHQQLRALL